jgi:hypothetical protein
MWNPHRSPEAIAARWVELNNADAKPEVIAQCFIQLGQQKMSTGYEGWHLQLGDVVKADGHYKAYFYKISTSRRLHFFMTRVMYSSRGWILMWPGEAETIDQ